MSSEQQQEEPKRHSHLFQMRDSYGADVSIDHSSAACSPCLWLRVNGGVSDTDYAAAHLTMAQAKLLSAGLSAAIAEAEGDA